MTIDALLLAAALLVLIVLERLPGIRFRRLRLLRPFFTSDLVYLATSTIALGLAMRAGAARLGAALGTQAPGAEPAWLIVPAAIVLYDLGAYTSHLWLHRSDLLWRFHKVHHSSRALDWLATFRGHALEHALRHVASPVLLLLLGFPGSAVAIATGVYGAWAAFVHANVRLDLRFLEPVLVTPRLHRLHHVARTGGANLGTLFSWWDRLRGTLVTDRAAALEPLGVPGEEETYPQRWLPQLVEPWRASGAAARAPAVSEA